MAIWNINSFAEFYMQIMEKYKKDYVQALQLFRAERSRFVAGLRAVTGLRVIPSQANYIMLEITNGVTAKKLTKNLLVKHNLFVKDLSGKIATGQYIRVAVRNTEDNNRLLKALKCELEI